VKKKLLLVVAVTLLVVASLYVPNAKAATTYEKEFIALINELRVNNSLNQLTENPGLTDGARVWAQALADSGTIGHDPNLKNALAEYDELGENVGMGGSVQAIFNALVASPGHHENMVRPEFSEIGVGVVASGDTLFTVHRFLDPVTNVTTTIAISIPTEILEPTTTTEVIGKICSPIYPKQMTG